MPLRTPNLYTSLGFWYKVSNSHPLAYKVNSSGIKWIAARLRRKVEEQKQGKRVRVANIPEFLTRLVARLQMLRARVLRGYKW